MKIAVLAGDGIGPEIVGQAVKVLKRLADDGLNLEMEAAPFGGAGFDAHGVPLPEPTLKLAKQADAVLCGAVGGPKYDALPRPQRPEQGILRIRKELGLFANLRPAVLYPELVHASTLKPEVVSGLDLMIIRELTGDVARNYPQVALSHMYVDNAAMQLVRNPKQFDVILTGNIFGDILSDEASMLTGSIGMLPSASLNSGGGGLYEPIHGSAPDIAGKNIANPLATILSTAMMLRYTFNKDEWAYRIEAAVKNVLAAGYRTPDIDEPGARKVGTVEMGDAVVAAL